MVFKQRTVQDASDRLFEEARVSLQKDEQAIRNLEWQQSTQMDALKSRNKFMQEHEKLRLDDFISAAGFKKNQDVATIKAVGNLIGPDGPGFQLLLNKAKENSKKGYAKGYQARQAELDKQKSANGFGADRIRTNSIEEVRAARKAKEAQRKADQVEQEREQIIEVCKKLGCEVGTLTGDLELDPNNIGKLWTEQDERNAETDKLIQRQETIIKTDQNSLVNRLPNTSEQSELLAGLSWLGERKGFKKGYAMHAAETFEANLLTFLANDDTTRTYKYKGEEVEYVPSQLNEDYASQETPLPYLHAIDAYKEQVLAEVAATGLNDSHIQTKIAPLLNEKAAKLKSTYRQNWANAKNKHWIKVTTQEVQTDFLESVVSNDMDGFNLVAHQYLKQYQAYAARLKIKDPKKHGIKLLKEALQAAAARSKEATGQTGLQAIKLAKIPVKDVPWVSDKKADKDGFVFLTEAFPKELSEAKIDEMDAGVHDDSYTNEKKIKDGEARGDMQTYVKAIAANDPDAPDLLSNWLTKYGADYPKLAAAIQDPRVLLKNTEAGYTYIMSRYKEKERLTKADLKHVSEQSIELAKQDIPEWDKIYIDMDFDHRVAKKDIEKGHTILTNTLRKDVLGSIDASALESGYTERVLDVTLNEILPDKLYDIALRYQGQNVNIKTASRREITKWHEEAVTEIMEEMINDKGKILNPGRYTADPIKGLIHFDRIHFGHMTPLDKEMSSDDKIIAAVQKQNEKLVGQGSHIFDKKNWQFLPTRLNPKQFELTVSGQPDSTFYVIANDPKLNPAGLDAEEIRQIFAEVQENPVEAPPPIDWENNKRIFVDLDLLKNIRVDDPVNNARVISECSATAPVFGTSNNLAIHALKSNWLADGKISPLDLSKKIDEEIIPFAINYKQTTNTKATPNQITLAKLLGMNLEEDFWWRNPELQAKMHELRCGGLN